MEAFLNLGSSIISAESLNSASEQSKKINDCVEQIVSLKEYINKSINTNLRFLQSQINNLNKENEELEEKLLNSERIINKLIKILKQNNLDINIDIEDCEESIEDNVEIDDEEIGSFFDD